MMMTMVMVTMTMSTTIMAVMLVMTVTMMVVMMTLREQRAKQEPAEGEEARHMARDETTPTMPEWCPKALLETQTHPKNSNTTQNGSNTAQRHPKILLKRPGTTRNSLTGPPRRHREAADGPTGAQESP